MAALLAGLPESVPGVTVNRLCGSGLEAVNDAARRIRSGEADIVIAGGVESMSRAPLVTLKPSEAFPRGERVLSDTTLGWRLVNPRMVDLGYHPISLGETAENVAKQEHIGRAEQDGYAARSQDRYGRAKANGFFAGEIQPVHNGKELVSDDEHPRADSSIEKLAKLKPAFRENGTVTAGNSSGINDGAAALIVAAREKARSLGLQPLGRIVASASAGVHPDYMGLGPIPAVTKLVERTRVAVHECDAIELNEAFAAQVLPCIRALGLPDDRTNPNGGAIAIGHPIGASGARLAGRQFLIATSAAALAACSPAAVTPGASGSAAPSATAGKMLKLGQLLPATGVYTELGNSMKRATELYLDQNDRKLAGRPVQL